MISTSTTRPSKRAPHHATSKSMPMPFLDHLIEAYSSTRHKRAYSSSFPEDYDVDMAFFAPPPNKFLNAPLAPSRKKSQRFMPTHNDIDEFLSSDLELSFASNVSLNSPPREHISLASDCAMDISPAPAPKPQAMLLSSGQRPRSYTSSGRLFGNDISNNRNPLLPSAHLIAEQQVRVVGGTQTASKKTQRAALPFEWLAPTRIAESSPVRVSPCPL